MKAPLSDIFRHRQTLANCVRFTTEELASAETRIMGAADRALAIELDCFDTLSALAIANERALCAMSAALAELDVYAALAELAEEQNYARPEVDASSAFRIEGGRHPVVEQALKKARSGPFIANDCDLSKRRLWLVTGPNMAGKSTFLRQNALIAILAQMGSYVPARAAHIGVADRLFSRVGASDDLARGRSTFMVEMVETAAILNQATDRSVVILDEIGRGTATFDGLSIAWAAVEHLHDINKSRALFATHYHELTEVAEKLEGATNVTVSVKEWKDNIVFLHEVVAGAADRSYGIQVAKLAGLPPALITRARQVLAKLEKQHGKPRGGLGRAAALRHARRPAGGACHAGGSAQPRHRSPRRARPGCDDPARCARRALPAEKPRKFERLSARLRRAAHFVPDIASGELAPNLLKSFRIFPSAASAAASGMLIHLFCGGINVLFCMTRPIRNAPPTGSTPWTTPRGLRSRPMARRITRRSGPK